MFKRNRPSAVWADRVIDQPGCYTVFMELVQAARNDFGTGADLDVF